MSQTMVNIWTSFAENRCPKLKNGNWAPVTSKYFVYNHMIYYLIVNFKVHILQRLVVIKNWL